MASELSISLIVGASAGAAMAVFGDLKGVMGRVAEATKNLKTQQVALGKQIEASAKQPGPALDALRAKYEQQKLMLDKLRASTVALGRSQAAIAANEAKRASLRGKIMETAALAYVAAAPYKIAAGFEDQIKDIAITGGFSREEETSLSGAAAAAAVKWNQTQEDIAGGLGVLVAGGIGDLEKLKAYAPVMAKAATASRAGMEDLGALAIALSGNLKIGAEGFEEALNRMAAAGKLGQFELKDMAKRLPDLASSYAAMGVTGQAAVNEIAAALQIARKGAGSNDAAANNFKNFLAKMFAPDTLKKFSDAGINLKSRMAQLAAKGLTPVQSMLEVVTGYMAQKGPAATKKFQDALSIKDDAERQAALDRLAEAYRLGEIFRDMQVMDFLRPMLQNKEEFESIKKAADEAAQANVLDKDFAKRMKGALEQWKRLKIFINDAAISLGDSILPMVNDFIAAIVPAIRWFSEFIKQHPVIVGWALKVGAGLLALKVAFLALSYAFLLLVSPVLHVVKIGRMLTANFTLAKAAGGGLADKLSAMFPLFGALRSKATDALTGLKKLFTWTAKFGRAAIVSLWLALVPPADVSAAPVSTFKKIGQALMALSRLMLANPVGLIVAGIVLAALLIYKYWRPIKAFFAEVWRGFTDTLAPVADGFKPLISAFAAAVQPIRALFGWFVDLIEPVEESGGAMRHWGRIVGSVIGHVVNVLLMAVSGWGMILSGLVDTVARVWENIKAFFSSGIDNIVAQIINFSPLGLFYQAFSGVLSWFGVELPGKFASLGSLIVDGLIGGISAKAAALGDALRGLLDHGVSVAEKRLEMNSPSRVFERIGGFVAQGLGQGIQGSAAGPVAAIKDMAASLAAAGALTMSIPSPALAAGPLPELMASPLPALAAGPLPPLTPRAPTPRNAPAGAPDGGQIQIIVNPAPGMDEQKLADLVARKLKEAQFGKEARARSRLTDYD
jgi:TP901 family phage tail tape measure protein